MIVGKGWENQTDVYEFLFALVKIMNVPQWILPRSTYASNHINLNINLIIKNR